jgi:hypothetical protein
MRKLQGVTFLSSRTAPAVAAASLPYRPRFAFAKGLYSAPGVAWVSTKGSIGWPKYAIWSR